MSSRFQTLHLDPHNQGVKFDLAKYERIKTAILTLLTYPT
jgi:hypothetical protein